MSFRNPYSCTLSACSPSVRKSLLLLTFGVVFAPVIATTAAMAQTGGEGAITGTVTDSTGAVIPNATVISIDRACPGKRPPPNPPATMTTTPTIATPAATTVRREARSPVMRNASPAATNGSVA